MKYFVCYTTRDKEVTSEFLNSLSKTLKKKGNVFVDLIDNDSEDKQQRVLFELDTSDLLVLIKTTSVYKSKWVAIELARAKEKGIPIRILTMAEILEKDFSFDM